MRVRDARAHHLLGLDLSTKRQKVSSYIVASFFLCLSHIPVASIAGACALCTECRVHAVLYVRLTSADNVVLSAGAVRVYPAWCGLAWQFPSLGIGRTDMTGSDTGPCYTGSDTARQGNWHRLAPGHIGSDGVTSCCLLMSACRL